MSEFKQIPKRGDRVEIPERFFLDVLPNITNILELKTSLIILNEIASQQTEGSFLNHADIENLEQLKLLETDGIQLSVELIESVLGKLTESNLIFSMKLDLEAEDSGEIYFLDDVDGRKLSEKFKLGIVSLNITGDNPKRGIDKGVTIFDLYEKNIGVIPGSQVAEELIEAEKTYPAQWLEDAFDEAVAQDVRRWAYIRAILASWSNGGRGNYDGKTGGRNSESRYKSGKYGKIVRST
tara:strand:+ start:36754 stop:37467 length:714 start_codon:yes stop_codon:yes gene_type:complete